MAGFVGVWFAGALAVLTKTDERLRGSDESSFGLDVRPGLARPPEVSLTGHNLKYWPIMTLQRRDRHEGWSVYQIDPVTAVCYFDGRAPQWSERIPRSLPCNYGDGDAIVHIEDVDILQEEPRHYPKLGLGDVYSRSCELRKCLLLPCPFAGV